MATSAPVRARPGQRRRNRRACVLSSLVAWHNALTPFALPEVDWASVRVGAFLGVAGAGLVLVSASPPVTQEIFASIMGAGRMLAGGTRESPRMNQERARWLVVLSVAALGATAGIASVTAAFLPSGAWAARSRDNSLLDTSFWAGLEVVIPAMAAIVAAVVIVWGRSIGERASGCLFECGLALVTLFLGAIGFRDGNAPVGAYLGVGAGIGLMLVGVAPLLVARLRSKVDAQLARGRTTDSGDR